MERAARATRSAAARSAVRANGTTDVPAASTSRPIAAETTTGAACAAMKNAAKRRSPTPSPATSHATVIGKTGAMATPSST